MLKVIGCAVTLASCAGLGLRMRRDISEHLMLLEDIRGLLTAISNDTALTMQPLGTVISARSYTANSVLDEALGEIAQSLASGEGRSGDEIWRDAFFGRRRELLLNTDEAEILEKMGLALFGRSVEDNRRQMNYLIGILEEKIAERRTEKREKIRTCGMLCMTGGLMMILIFL